jgi:aminoglycoside phosphotransferase (APT) family kinase protein
MTNKTKFNIKIAENLISDQFPEWQNLPITPVKNSGWDNYSYRLGNDLLLRFPSHNAYISSVKKEQYWLPKLAKELTIQIPTPVATGRPNRDYPYPWSIYQWIPGEIFDPSRTNSLNEFATDLALFLKSFEAIDAKNGPQPSEENFYRGGDLSKYTEQTHQAINMLDNKIDTQKAYDIWDVAINNPCEQKPVWVHGDMSMGNILVKDGKLTAIIDFGQMCVGDPACDLVPYWTLFDSKQAELFKQTVNLDTKTWQRARGWALWKFLIVEAGLTSWNKFEGANSKKILEKILNYD